MVIVYLSVAVAANRLPIFNILLLERGVAMSAQIIMEKIFLNKEVEFGESFVKTVHFYVTICMKMTPTFYLLLINNQLAYFCEISNISMLAPPCVYKQHVHYSRKYFIVLHILHQFFIMVVYFLSFQ